MNARFKSLIVIGLVVVFVFGVNTALTRSHAIYAKGGDSGEQTFKSNCLGCHSIGGGDGVGPDLQGVTERMDREWLVQFIMNPKALVDSGDEAANKLVKQYGMVMPASDLGESEIAAVLDYLASASSLGGSGSSGGSGNAGGASSQGSSDGAMTLPLFTLYGIAGALLLFLFIGTAWRRRLKAVRKNLR